MNNFFTRSFLLFCGAAGVWGCAAQDGMKAADLTRQEEQSSDVIENADREAFFGELHLHTSQSFDAFVMGVRTSVDDAYRFGRGDTIEFMGQMVKRDRPLDFMAVTDHAEQMGLGEALLDADNPLSKTDFGRSLVSGTFDMRQIKTVSDSPLVADNLNPKSVWARTIASANRFNEPGKFTTLIGYEWSSMPNNANLHRNILFRGDSAPLPFSANDSMRPEDLWSYMEASRERGFANLAIPHNANLSNGLMYDWVQSDGRPIDEAYAQRRALNEPISEIAQNKGQSETLPELSPDDPFADFEIKRELMISNVKAKFPGGYIRDALGRGLLLNRNTGANPYKFGVIGSTDTHSGLTTSSEKQWSGLPWTIADVTSKDVAAQSIEAVSNDLFQNMFETLDGSAGALAGVWAESNTRGSIFDAMRRRETFGTSGTRIRVRLFGGWSFNSDSVGTPGWVAKAYRNGVAMGSDMAAAPAGKAPRFIVWAAKDPDGVGLERAQIIKVWLDGDERREKVFDTYIAKSKEGDALIQTVWTDPEFRKDQAAVYYLRVLEVKSPRWSTLLAQKFNLLVPKRVPAYFQERAWSSPIWITPAI